MKSAQPPISAETVNTISLLVTVFDRSPAASSTVFAVLSGYSSCPVSGGVSLSLLTLHTLRRFQLTVTLLT